MKVSPLHLLHQGPVLATLAQTVLAGLKPGRTGGGEPPGPEIVGRVPPRPRELVRDYVRHVGGDPSWYRGRLPFHLFPQWGVPILARTLRGLPYNLIKVMNAGCAVTVHRDLPPDRPLALRAQLERVDADERRVVLYQRLVTGTDDHPEAQVVEQRAIIKLAGAGAKKAPRERPAVPVAAREVGRFRVGAGAGLDFAVLTGDLNPLHWLGAYARASGHRGPILHGFSTLARAVEVLNRNLWASDPGRLGWIEVRFTRPLPVPTEVGVYVNAVEGALGLYVGRIAGGPAYLTGRLRTKEPSDG